MSSPLHALNGDVRLAYELRGRRNGWPPRRRLPVLLIHGLGYNRAGWGPAAPRLAKHFPLVLFDNRGVGQSDAPDGPYTVEGMAQDALAVLDAVGLEKAHVLGTSLGGMVAQELALRWPDRVERLVLACTMPGVRGYPLPRRTLKLFSDVPKLPLDVALRRLIENALADDTVARRPELVEEIFAYRVAHPPPTDGWKAQTAAGMGFDALHRLAEIRVPTLVMHGTADNVVDVRNATLLAERIPDAQVQLFPDTGHLFFWEEPERFATTVAGFLAEGA